MILTILLIVCLAGAAASLIISRYAKDIALATSLVLVASATLCFGLFSTAITSYQLGEQVSLVSIGSFSVNYHIGIDGISFVLVLLTILLAVVSVLVSRREIHMREGPFYATLLGLVAAVIGVFISLDLVLFFVFWEIVLVLTFLLIILWGGDNRKYAGMKFLLYTGLGSAFLLFAIILLAIRGAADFTTIGSAALPAAFQVSLLCILLVAFFIKIPIVPFHTWLPDAHVQAPTAGSIMLAGVLLKMGAYALLRFAIVLPAGTASLRPFLFFMGTVTILYGAWVCLAQQNLKKLIAYSSVNHMGFVLLGIATGSALGVTGAVFEMISHGLIAALLFALAGLIHQQTGTFDIDALHGLIRKMPTTAWFLVLAALAGLGLPSMTGFIAEFLVLFASFITFGAITFAPLLGMIITGGYFLRMLAKAVFGRNDSLRASEQKISHVPFAILLAVIFLLGILPFLLITFIKASVLT